MALPRYNIPTPGVTPRLRSTFVLNASLIPPEVLLDETDIPRWLAGVSFNTLGCDPLQRIESIICGEVDDDSTKEAYGLGEVVGFDSFAIYDAKEGSLLCDVSERLIGDVMVRYPSMVSEQLANELMEGGSRPFDPLEPESNPTFVSAATAVTGGPFTPSEAIAILEQEAANVLHGAEATFHLTPRGFGSLTAFDLADGIDAPGYRTAQGHKVIADAGYTGAAPTTGSITADEYWYMSGPVFWAMTQAAPLGLPTERLDISINYQTEIFEAFAVVLFDPCAVRAVPVSYDL